MSAVLKEVHKNHLSDLFARRNEQDQSLESRRRTCMQIVAEWAPKLNWLKYDLQALNGEVQIVFTPRHANAFTETQLATIRVGMANINTRKPTYAVIRSRHSNSMPDADYWRIRQKKK